MTRKRLPITFHPRVFAALGSDLVTNDLVAITELVKNSYDAYATRVDVRFGVDESGEYIEVLDNGRGMDRKTIEDVWCMVATPHRQVRPTSRRNRRIRRASGEKGLGRLSAARLGKRLEMATKARGQTCWHVTAEWEEIARAKDISLCGVDIEECAENRLFKRSGTRLRIYGLKSEWNDERIEELKDYLRRLVSPFKQVRDFSIVLSPPGGGKTAVKITPPKFLNEPKYAIHGTVDDAGVIAWTYAFRPIGEDRIKRSVSGTCRWADIRSVEAFGPVATAVKRLDRPDCGPFSFEFRAWDIDPEGVNDIARNYDLGKRSIREAVRSYKGISVYRDGILVLPKSEASRDWLGLDRHRISDVGKRLGTSQVVGYVAISAEGNPKIKDTSDRERLADQPEVHAFEHILQIIVVLLEKEREKDRLEKRAAERPLKEVFRGLSADQLVEDVAEAAKDGASAQEALPIVKKFGKELAETREEIERRFVYYSRLATIGTMAELIVHEVRNKTTIIDSLLRELAAFPEGNEVPDLLGVKLDRAQSAIASLDRLADTFAPLASRSFRRGGRSCDLTDRVRHLLDSKSGEIKRSKIEVVAQPKEEYPVAIDPGELDAILLNVLDNALYWLRDRPADEGQRQLAVRARKLQNGERVEVFVDDSGPGVAEDDMERIFWPGVTKKPGGIGMGLTVASELVDAHGGRMGVTSPGRLGGATFKFDLPTKK